MMNLIDMVPANPAGLTAAEPGEAAVAGVPQTTSSPAFASGDSLAYGQSGLAALAYSTYAQNGKSVAASLRGVASDAERDEALVARFGPSVALVRGALPSALQGQFVAQLMAANDRTATGETPASGATALSEHDLAKLVSAGAGNDDDNGIASLLVSRLAQDVARYGAASVAQALQLAHDRIAFATDVASPGAQQPRVARRDGEPRDARRRPQHEPPERPDLDDAPVAADPNPIYTIEDVVRFSDATIATHRMASPPPLIERNPA